MHPRASEQPYIRLPSTEELAYLAGVMDSDGYFAQGSQGTNSFGLRVAVTNHAIVEWLHEKFVGSVSRAGVTTAGNRIHTWTLQRQADLLFLLPLLIPYLVGKKAQASSMLELVQHLRTFPRHNIPSSEATRKLRLARQEHRQAWNSTREALRQKVVEARQQEKELKRV